MREYWLDTNSFIEPYQKYYCFDRVPNFWTFLEQKSREGVIVSPTVVLTELEEGCKKKGSPDELLIWARKQAGTMFLMPDSAVQLVNSQIADYVKDSNKSTPWRAQVFLRGADSWTIAHAKALGGRVVTFETSNINSRRIKIPDVADHFDIKCLDLHKMLAELKARF
jgi:hypothetical protein